MKHPFRIAAGMLVTALVLGVGAVRFASSSSPPPAEAHGSSFTVTCQRSSLGSLDYVAPNAEIAKQWPHSAREAARSGLKLKALADLVTDFDGLSLGRPVKDHRAEEAADAASTSLTFPVLASDGSQVASITTEAVGFGAWLPVAFERC